MWIAVRLLFLFTTDEEDGKRTKFCWINYIYRWLTACKSILLNNTKRFLKKRLVNHSGYVICYKKVAIYNTCESMW